MKKIVAMFAVFCIAAFVAAYVAMAPLASFARSGAVHSAFAVLDATAAQLIAIGGRSVAVIGLMALGVVLSLLIALGGRGGAAAEAPATSSGWRRRKQSEDIEPGPVWRADPLSQEDRIASLRRRAVGETGASPESQTVAPMPRPVILVRKPRERGRDWFRDRSWLGALPRLGDAEWPRDAGGTPLPFAAQIDLAELSAACPESPLPRTGSLAFFLGTGAVVAVPEGEHDFTDPPQDLPAAYDEGGYPFPAKTNRLSRYFFPFWPVEPVMLDLPEELRDHRDARHDQAIEKAMADQLAHHAARRDQPFAAGDDVLWWHGVHHLADELHIAFDGSARLVALRQDGAHRAEELLASLESQSGLDETQLEAAREDLAQRQADLAAIEAECRNLPEMIAAIDQFGAGRAQWQQLTREECDIVADFLAELHRSCGDLVRFHAPLAPAELTILSLRTMVTGAPEALAAMPEEQLVRINRDYRLANMHQHQVFGLGGCPQSARDEHRGDVLLLQLGYDDMMEWRWGDMGLYQFWIGPQDAAAGNWAAVQLTFECS